MRRTALASPPLALLIIVAGCAGPTPTEQPQLSAAQRDDQFWTAYEQRLGMVGKDYADPVAAKRGSIEFGHVICEELDKGIDRDAALSSLGDPAEARVKLDTAIEFLCPQHSTG